MYDEIVYQYYLGDQTNALFLELLNFPEGTQSDPLKKRKRDDEEASGSDKTSPGKRRKGSLDGGQG